MPKREGGKKQNTQNEARVHMKKQNQEAGRSVTQQMRWKVQISFLHTSSASKHNKSNLWQNSWAGTRAAAAATVEARGLIEEHKVSSQAMSYQRSGVTPERSWLAKHCADWNLGPASNWLWHL